jgi:hypothetical protein
MKTRATLIVLLLLLLLPYQSFAKGPVKTTNN